MGSLIPVLALLLLHGPHRDDGYVADDAVAAQCAARPLLNLFADRRDALCYSGVHFTPLLPASFKIDWVVSGSDATGSRAHNLLVAAVLAIGACGVLARMAGIWVGSLLTTAWVLSPPFTLVTGWLVTRQYLWGLLLSGVAIAGQRRWLSAGSRVALGISLLAFLSALLWKDVYLPVVVLVTIGTPGSIRERVAAAVPFALVAAFYFAWRVALLGGIGGYGEIGLSLGGLAAGIAASPFVAFRELFGIGWLWPLPFLVGGMSSVIETAAIWSAVVAPLAVVFPSTPVGVFEMRYLFPCSAVAYWMVARALGRRGASVRWIGASLILGSSLWFGLPRSLAILEELRSAGREGEVLLQQLETTACERITVVGLTRTPQWFATGMKRLHAERMGRQLPTAVLVGDVAAQASRGLLPLDDARLECGLFAYRDGRLTRTNGEVARSTEAWLAERVGQGPGITATVSGGSVDLQWTRIDGAIRYLLFYGEESDVYGAALPVPSSGYPARNLPSGRYFFRVAAVGPDGSIGPLSEQVEVIVPGAEG